MTSEDKIDAELRFRVATQNDIPRIDPLIEASVRGLSVSEYSPSQMDQALGTWLGLDTQLVTDGTYFVVEAPGPPGALAACGGWSRRRTPYGSDHRPGRDDALLDPKTDAAKIRAFFVHPDWARRGIGSRLLEMCEAAARAEGFTRCEMGATLPGVPLYRRHGYVEGDRVELPLANGETLPIVKMEKRNLTAGEGGSILAGQEEGMPSEGNVTGARVTLHVVSSLDGFIARKDNSVSWLDVRGKVYEAGVSVSAEEAANFVRAIDCYVLGSRTYEHALELGWPYGDTPTVVLTSRKLASDRKSVEFYSGDLKTLVHANLAPRFRNIWLVGGAMVCQRFLELGLVDEIRLTIAPVMLGDGLRLFGHLSMEKSWDLKNVVAYRNGFVDVSYAASAV